MKPLTTKAVVDFEEAADALYDPRDSQRGYIELVKRSGEVQQANLVTLSIGVSLSTSQRFTDPREAVSIASDMKTVAKKFNGSYVAYDRRR